MRAAGRISGDIRVNGFPWERRTFARISGYVEQTDVNAPKVRQQRSCCALATCALVTPSPGRTSVDLIAPVNSRLNNTSRFTAWLARYCLHQSLMVCFFCMQQSECCLSPRSALHDCMRSRYPDMLGGGGAVMQATVWEALAFSAALRLAPSVSKQERADFVEKARLLPRLACTCSCVTCHCIMPESLSMRDNTF